MRDPVQGQTPADGGPIPAKPLLPQLVAQDRNRNRAAGRIRFEGLHYRRDIGARVAS